MTALALSSAGIVSAATPKTPQSLGVQAAQSVQEKSSKLALSTTQLPPVTVAAHSFGVPVQNTGVSVTKLEVAPLEKEGIYNLDQALQRVPGVYVNNESGQRGANSPIRLRGLNSAAYTLTVVDGMRISDANVPGSAFFGTQSLMGFGSMEVVRGPQGAVYGAQAVGGIIALTLPTGSGEPSYKLFAEGGSFGSFTGAASTQGEVGKLSYSILTGYESTQNDPQHPRRFKNDPGFMDYSQIFESGRLVYSICDKSSLSVSFRHSDNKFERPGYGDSEITRLKDTHDMTLVSATYKAELSRFWSTELLAGYYGYNFEEKGFLQSNFGDFDNYSATDYYKTQVEWKNLLTWNKEWKTSLGVAWDRMNYTTPNTLLHPVDNVYAGYAEQFWSPLEGLDFSLAGRWENYEKWGNQSAWRFGSSWQVAGKDSSTRLFGTVGSGFKAPTQVDLFGWGSYSKGNPNLKPTDAMGYDLGIEQKLNETHTLTVAGFWTHLSDIIVGMDPINNGKANAYGVESALTGSFEDAWNSGYSLAYTYTNAYDKEGKQLPCTARNVVNADIYTSPIESVTVGLGLESSMGRANFTFGDNKRVDDYCNMRLYVRWKTTETLTLHARVENLLNQEYMLSDERSTYAGQTSGGFFNARRIGFFAGATLEF